MQATEFVTAQHGEDVEEERRPWARWLLRGVLVVVVAVFLLVAIGGIVAAQSLRSARSDGARVRAALSSGDVTRAGDAVVALSHHLAVARAALWGPQWIVPQALPWYGDDVKAVRRTVFALHDTVDGTVDPLLGVVGSLQDGVRRPDGSIDSDRIAVLEADLGRVAGPAQQAARSVDQINLAGVARPIRGPLREARDAVDLVDHAVRTSQDGLVVASAVLGAKGRTGILVGVQNPSEARGTGGIVGALAVISAERGHLRLVRTDVNDELIRYKTPRSDLPPDMVAVYGTQVRDIRNVNLSPDFPRVAPLMAASFRRYAEATGTPTTPSDSTVVTITPAALGRLLAVTGPVSVPGGPRITADNAAALFGAGVYEAVPDTKTRNAYVQTVLTTVFRRLTTTQVDTVRLVEALRSSSSDEDLMVWSPRRDVQEAIVGLGADGGIGAPDGTSVRISLVNTDGSKLDYWNRTSIALETAKRLTISLRNDVPASVPFYAQTHLAGLSPTTHQLVVQVHLPPTAGVRGAAVDGLPTAFATGREQGWTVVRVGLTIPRGSTRRLVLELDGGVGLDRVVPPTTSSRTVVTVDGRPQN